MIHTLEKEFKRVHKLSHAMSILGWDEAVMMPVNGGVERAETLAELSVMSTEIFQSEKMKDLIVEAKDFSNGKDEWTQAHIRSMVKTYEDKTALPIDLVEKISLQASKCEQAWRSLRKENNWKDFLPIFREVVSLAREEASIRSEKTGLGLYDSMMDMYEPGLKTKELDVVFNRLKNFLPDFVQTVTDNQKSKPFISPKGKFDIQKQRELGLFAMKTLGFDFDSGRLDVSHHPFCGGVPVDVRLTTRYKEDSFHDSLMGVVHETGHALYEQHLPKQWLSYPIGSAQGMAIHESQSLFFEMQVGCGLPFLSYIAPKAKELVGNSETDARFWDPQNIARFYNQVKPGFIRVESDEVTYPLHVIKRYEIEKDLIEGKMDVDDLPERWDDSMQKYLGLSTKGNFKDGCMQDVHWPSGAFGYFPSYSLGAMYAAQLFQKLKREQPQIESEIARGDFTNVRAFLKDKIWRWGSYFSTSDELMIQATGEKLNADYFEKHLRERYLLV